MDPAGAPEEPVGCSLDMGLGVSPSEDHELEVEAGIGGDVEVGRGVPSDVAPCVVSSDVEGFADSGDVGDLVLPWVDMGLGVSPSELAVEDCIRSDVV